MYLFGQPTPPHQSPTAIFTALTHGPLSSPCSCSDTCIQPLHITETLLNPAWLWHPALGWFPQCWDSLCILLLPWHPVLGRCFYSCAIHVSLPLDFSVSQTLHIRPPFSHCGCPSHSGWALTTHPGSLQIPLLPTCWHRCSTVWLHLITLQIKLLMKGAKETRKDRKEREKKV